MLTVTKVWADHCSSLLDRHRHKAPSVSRLPFTTDRAFLDTFLQEEKNGSPVLIPKTMAHLQRYRSFSVSISMQQAPSKALEMIKMALTRIT